MLKNILNLDGAQKLSQKQQQSINGGATCAHICANAGNYPAYQCIACECVHCP